MADQELDRRHRFTVLRPTDAAGARPAALDILGISREHVDLLRGLVAPFLGAGCDLAIDGEVVARGPEGVESSPGPSTLQVQRLTEMAVQQHEYLCAELRRIRDEFEAEFAPERALLRVLRQRWMERVCDDRVRGEDALRYVFETAHAAATKADPSPSGQ